jgi:hypothetical protein
MQALLLRRCHSSWLRLLDLYVVLCCGLCSILARSTWQQTCGLISQVGLPGVRSDWVSLFLDLQVPYSSRVVRLFLCFVEALVNQKYLGSFLYDHMRY